MGKNIVLKNKPIELVSMAMHNALLKNGDVPANVLISLQQLIQKI